LSTKRSDEGVEEAAAEEAVPVAVEEDLGDPAAVCFANFSTLVALADSFSLDSLGPCRLESSLGFTFPVVTMVAGAAKVAGVDMIGDPGSSGFCREGERPMMSTSIAGDEGRGMEIGGTMLVLR
jgi:hypothetical protein